MGDKKDTFEDMGERGKDLVCLLNESLECSLFNVEDKSRARDPGKMWKGVGFQKQELILEDGEVSDTGGVWEGVQKKREVRVGEWGEKMEKNSSFITTE